MPILAKKDKINNSDDKILVFNAIFSAFYVGMEMLIFAYIICYNLYAATEMFFQFGKLQPPPIYQ